MAEYLVGARIEGDAKGLVAAGKAGEETVKKLEEAAARAAARLDELAKAGQRSGGAAKPLKETGDELERFLRRVDPAARAQQDLVRGQELLTKAVQAGNITQAEFTDRMAELEARHKLAEQASARQAAALGGLGTIQTRVNQIGLALRATIGGLVTGMVQGAVVTAAVTAATLAAAAAYDLLSGKSRRAAFDEEAFARALEKTKAGLGDVQLSAYELALQREAETESGKRMLEELIEAEKKRAASMLELSRQFAPPGATGDDPNASYPVQVATRTLQGLQAALTVFRALRGEFAQSGVEQGIIWDAGWSVEGRRPAATPPKPPEKTGGGPGPIEQLLRSLREDAAKAAAEAAGVGRAGAAYAELEAKLKSLKATKTQAAEATRLFLDALENRGRAALAAYGTETEKLRQILAAEIAGRRELIPLIELEFQLREQFGAKFVEQHRARIAAMAAERAELDKVRERWQATSQFIEAGAGQLGTVIEATLALPLDRSASKWETWANTATSAIRQVTSELIRMSVVNPILNAILGGNRYPTAYGQGGIFDLIMGFFPGSTSGAGSANSMGPAYYQHAGGFAGDGPAKIVDLAAWRNAKRYHGGGFAGDEVPVIAKRGEPIFSPRQFDNLNTALQAVSAGPGLEIKIIDQRGAGAPKVQMRQGVGAGGRRQIELLIRDVVRGQLAAGDYDTAAEQSWGVFRRGSK